ncbi:MAG: cell surface protein SprA [Paludibacteraceae bacterium]|nr:cell surface protein SprA [Paludibacteraceae bacterium]
MSKAYKRILATILACSLFCVLGGSLFLSHAELPVEQDAAYLFPEAEESSAATASEPFSVPMMDEEDTTATAAPQKTSKPRFPVNNLEVVTYEDLQKKYAIDLPNPDNVSTSIEFDNHSGAYIVHTKIGDFDIASPMVLSADEYKRLSLQKEMQNYWNQKNAEASKDYEDKFNITDMKFSLGPADKVFGPGGVQIKMQGSAELKFSFNHNYIQNPSLSERLKKNNTFDFDEIIQVNVNASVGDKIKFGLNYNTQATFDFDEHNLTLAYEGKEDDIIKKIEAGNVSMQLNSALITGSSALFGIKGDLQFGKFRIQALASQQRSTSQNVSTNGSVQLEKFEITADAYEENRHFFLAQFFRDNYEKNMEQLPQIASGVTINRIEVWITNKRNNYNQSRNLICFSDLGEPRRIDGPWTITGQQYPDNNANSLYNTVSQIPNIRTIDQFTATMNNVYAGQSGVNGGEHYEKIESARLLTTGEYTLNQELGYITLNTALNADEVLAVAFEYTAGGKVYQVGEFSTDGVAAPQAIMVKLLKGTSVSPHSAVWDLMMKNVYALNASSINPDNFKLSIFYRNDSAGIELNYIPEGNIKNMVLLRAMNLDRLNAFNNVSPDGRFDFVEGYTINSSTGRIIFPVLEPFGSHLRKMIGNDAIADKYVYEELYDSTLVMAREFTEKNKFLIMGEYQGNNTSEIRLNAMNVPKGSVVVTAGGTKLIENVDYTVNYNMGIVTILNQSILNSNTPIDVHLENQDVFNQQRRSMFGTHVEYAFNKDFKIGGTIMHLTEMPLYTKTAAGSEPVANTIWGFNANYMKESQWLTRMIDKLPLLEATAPSSFSFSGEFAQMIPGHRKIKNNPGYAYLDDFEATETTIDLTYPFYWHLASTPSDPNATSGFLLHGTMSNDIQYGVDRALFNWYTVDNNVFNMVKNSSMPAHIRNDAALRSNHLTRLIRQQELFPNKDLPTEMSNYLTALNISFYPQERGPYNLDVNNINPDGTLSNPRNRWGGMMRKLETTDFEKSNIEYIEFWLMDPFVNDSTGTAQGGDLYINIGDISEDILKDGKKFFENGMPANGDTTQTTSTVWGRVPTAQSTVLAFSSDQNSREYQDVGLNGLHTDDEFTFPTYRSYLADLRQKLSPAVVAAMQQDPFSPFNDPAGDNYHHYRGDDYDNQQLSIIERYKHYNGVEGNSPASDESTTTYSKSATTIPDVEDLNQDNTLNEYEKYFQYRISLRKGDMQVGQNFIADRRDVTIEMADGKPSTVTWYQFKVPVADYEKRVGSIRDFKSIRFMRLYLTDYAEETHLRFGTLQLVRGEWRNYTKTLYDPTTPPATAGTMDISSVNIEENGSRTPVNYILPPGVTREVDPSNSQMSRLNEQSMVMRVYDLAPGDARAVYKNTTYDMRRYRRFQMFTHAEQMIDDPHNLQDYDLSIFVRMGSDLQRNYYEYEIPLRLTPAGFYTESTADVVWPEDNMFDFLLERLTDAKQNRNIAMQNDPTISLTHRYSETDPDHPNNHITVVGNPNLSEIRSMMIGVRNNNPQNLKTGEIWVNEMRMTDYNENGGWGALGNASINFSDIASLNVSGRYETAGFGGIEQNLIDRRLEDYGQFNISTQFEVGRFFPEKAKVSLPLYVSYSVESERPQYNPTDKDVLLSDAIHDLQTSEQRDSLKAVATSKVVNKSVNLTNVRIDHRGERPHIYDPANFSASYSYTQSSDLDPQVERDNRIAHHGSFNYNFSTSPQTWEPFKKSKKLQSPHLRLIKDFGINYQPSLLAFSINIDRLYNETQMRDLDGSMNIDVTDPTNPLLSSSKSFTWGREFQFRYDLTKNLKFSFTSGTDSRFEESLISPVNKKLFPTEYENWRDTILQSMRHGGLPLQYDQTFTATWNLPLNKIPFLDWMTANAQYSSSYSWDYGTVLGNNTNTGNIIGNISSWQVDGNLNFEKLYNKSKYLKGVQQRTSSSKTANALKRNNSRTQFTPRSFSKTISAEPGKSTDLKHNLNSTTFTITFVDKEGHTIKVPYREIDPNNIRLKSRHGLDSVTVTIETRNPAEGSQHQNATDYLTRFLLLVRRGSISYKESSALTVPGFQPSIGFMGQKSAGNGLFSPGLAFAFGMPGTSFIEKAIDNNWLFMNDSIINPATHNHSQDLDIKVNLEPLPGFKIDLMAKYTASQSRSIQYMFDGMPTQFTGTFQMTHIAIATTFWRRGKVDQYDSRAFQLFEQNRQVVADRFQQRYQGVRYPTQGFMANHELAGQTFDETNGGVNINSPDVLIPAFFAAYSGRDISRTSTNIIPSLWSLLPNWKVSYDGLSKIPWVAKHFRSITINHQYTCTYNIGSYSSYANYVENEDGFGFVRNVTNGNPIPSSAYDVSTVVLNESFMPLISLDFALKNSLTFKGEYKQQRTISLNLTSTQVVEATSQEYVFGIGYVLKDFNVMLKTKSNRVKKVKNDLTLRLDLGYKNIATIISKLDSDDVPQATAGSRTMTVKFTADYVFSSRLNFRFFYDYQSNAPLITTSYPMSDSNIGLSIKLMLTR